MNMATGLRRFQKRLRDNQALAERNRLRLDKDVRAAVERLVKVPGRSVMIIAVQKCGSSFLGQEFCQVGYTGAADDSLPEADELMVKLCPTFRSEMDKVKKSAPAGRKKGGEQ